MHASIPIGLTPELLHLIRINFLPGVPRVAESDLLLQGLCCDTGGGTFEMSLHVREFLLGELRRDPELGPERSGEVASLLLQVADTALAKKSGPSTSGFWQAQRWAALAELQIDEAIGSLAGSISKDLSSKENHGTVAARVAQALAVPLFRERALLLYATGVRKAASGDYDTALKFLQDAGAGENAVLIRGVPLPPASDVLSHFKVLAGVGAESSEGASVNAQGDGEIDEAERGIALASLLGLLQAPATRLAQTLNEPASSLVRVLAARVSQLDASK